MPVAVDAPDTRIGAPDVTQAVTEPPPRVPRAERAPPTFGAATRAGVADRGSDDGAEVQPGDAQGWTVDRPTPPTSATTTRGLCGQERFPYPPAQEVSVGPAGDTWTDRLGTAEQGRTRRDESTAAGGRCALNAHGPRRQDQRRLTRGD